MQRTLLAAVLFAGFLAGVTGIVFLVIRGTSSADPLTAIPSDAEAVILVPSLPSLMRGLAKSRMAGSGDGDEWELAAAMVAELTDARGISYQPGGAKMARVLRGAAALGVIRPSRQGASADLVLALSVGVRDDAFLAWSESALVPSLARGEATSSRRTHRGKNYLAIRSPASGAHLFLASQSGVAIASTSRDAMESALSALSGREPSIASTSGFRRVRREFGNTSLLTAYAAQEFIETSLGAGSHREGAAGDWRHLLASAPRIEAAAVSVSVDAGGMFRERARLFVSSTSGTLLGEIFGERPREIATASELPEGYPLYVAASFARVDELWDRLPAWLGPLFGQEPAKLRERMGGLHDFLDAEFRRDLLDTLGDEVAMAIDPGSPRSLVIALKPSDEGGMKRLLKRMDGLARAADAYRGPGSEESGVTSYQVDENVSVTPSYLVSGARLVLGASPEALQSLRSRRSAATSGTPKEHIFAGAPPSHVVLDLDTEMGIAWLRRRIPAETDAASDAWTRRVRELLPGSRGPMPRTTAGFVLMRDGVAGEWTSPVSPTLLAALFLVSPGPSPSDGTGPEPPPDEDAPAR